MNPERLAFPLAQSLIATPLPLLSMPIIASQIRLEHVEYIEGSGSGVLDFAVEGENIPYTWIGTEDADWSIQDVDNVENGGEDRFIMYPESDFFVCEINASGEEGNEGPVRCWCE